MRTALLLLTALFIAGCDTPPGTSGRDRNQDPPAHASGLGPDTLHDLSQRSPRTVADEDPHTCAHDHGLALPPGPQCRLPARWTDRSRKRCWHTGNAQCRRCPGRDRRRPASRAHCRSARRNPGVLCQRHRYRALHASGTMPTTGAGTGNGHACGRLSRRHRICCAHPRADRLQIPLCSILVH